MARNNDWIFTESQEIFRKTEFYSLTWNIDTTQLFSASFGGPIALTRDLNKPDIRPFISICSQSGKFIKSFQMDEKSPTIGVGWTFTEDFIAIKENGEIQLYSMFGSLKTLFNIIKDGKALDCRIFHTMNSYSGTYSTGIVVLTSKRKFLIVKDIYEQKLQQFPELPSQAEFESWCVISTDRKCYILVSMGNNLYQLNLGSSAQLIKTNIPVQFSQVVKMVPSFNNDLIALSLDTGHIFVLNLDLTRIVHKYQPNDPTPTKYLAWVANNAFIAYWDCLYLVPIGGDDPKNHTEIYGYSPPLYFVQEIDGLRLISSEKNEFLQLVPKPLKDVFGLAAFESSSTLHEASICFYEEKNQRAEEYIRSLKVKENALEQAIQNCISAAPHAFEVKYQVELLRAALFGRYFDEYANAQPYVEMCQTIRVLNAIRANEIGLPLTYDQYEALTPAVVISRLIARRHFALAIEVSKYLNMSNEEGIIKILSHWAQFKVEQTDIDDDRIAVMIKSKLGDTPGISYAEIARCAITAGRPGLAIKLLEYETKASEQVPLYIEIDNPDLALRKAMESGDSDLIYMVLFWYQSKFNNVSDFMKHISKNAVALSLMLQYYRQKNTTEQGSNELSDILNQENLVLEQVISILKVANKQSKSEQKLQMLDEARRLFGNDDKFSSSLLSDEIKLLKFQEAINKNFKLNLVGKTLYETIGELIKLNILEEAEKLRKEFKLSDTSETWWHLKAKNLAKGQLWDELEKFSKSKKSVIGYEPFITYCMEANNPLEARKYFPKVLPENRFKCLIKMKSLGEALDMAYQSKDEHGISIVISKCDHSTQRALIDKAKQLKLELIQQQK